jgi:hypothetical protein
MRLIASNLGREVERVVQGAALTVDQAAVLSTPVDTGRARGNWIATIGSPATNADQEPDKPGYATIAKAEAAVRQFKIGDIIYISNNVEYIVPLNEGHSPQRRPEGMTDIAMAEGREYVKRARFRLGG